jgi:hypothetical protein
MQNCYGSLRHVETCSRSGNNKQNSNILVMFGSGMDTVEERRFPIMMELRMKTSSHSKTGDLKRMNRRSATCTGRTATKRSEKWRNGQCLHHEYVHAPSARICSHKGHDLFPTLHTPQTYTSLFQTFKLEPSQTRWYKHQKKIAEYTRGSKPHGLCRYFRHQWQVTGLAVLSTMEVASL